MKIIGWIRKGDKASCGGVVLEGVSSMTSHGGELSFQGAAMDCKKNCKIAEGVPTHTLSNGQQQAHHGHTTVPGKCPIISTLNDIHGKGNAGGGEVPSAYRPDKENEGEWIPVVAPRKHEDSDFDQHLIFEDQDGRPLEGIYYRMIDARGAVIEGTTCASGKTSLVAGDDGDELNCGIAKVDEE
jgi:uncharacterized Zn-binding protein involved in type VI secretion